MKFDEFLKTLISFAIRYVVPILCLVLFFQLLNRDPFSERTLIPNFEPYPDTIHYVNPARSLISGQGLRIVREGREFYPNVPPLYSLVLVPFYMVNNDPRVFYYANVFLAILSFLLFYLILKKLFENPFIVGLTLLIFASNFYLHWIPTLAMAENLTLPLFLGAFYLLLLKPTAKKTILFGLILTGLLATKYAHLPLSITFFILYGVSIFSAETDKKMRNKNLLLLLVSFLVSFGVLMFYEIIIKKNVFTTVIPTSLTQGSSTNKTAWFSLSYIGSSLPFYIKTLLGDETRFLWIFKPILHKGFAIIGISGFIVSLFVKQLRFASVSLVVLLLTSILFLSLFYTVDSRYISYAIPVLLLGFGLFLESANNFFDKGVGRVAFYAGVGVLFSIYFLMDYRPTKAQILLNQRFSEIPWYYKSVLTINGYLKESKKNSKKPIVITAMIPYFIDFYSNGNYTLLPLHKEQEFRGTKEYAWGTNDYSDLLKLYDEYLSKGYSLYVASYGIGNETYLKDAYTEVEKHFILTQVAEGCYNTCNLYKVEAKNANGY